MAQVQSTTVVLVPGSDRLRTVAFEAVVTAAIGGSPGDINKLFLWIRPALTRYCRARIGTGSVANGDVDDVVQEVCIGLLSALPTFADSPSRFRPFLYGIASHKIVDHYRRRGRDRSDNGVPLPDSMDPAPGPEPTAVTRDSAARVVALINRLNDRQRDILSMRVVSGLSSEEAAQKLGVTAVAVRVTQHRALNLLRKAIAADS
jgi:RNA polymerase sigma-70 factor, ECF subfamily